MPISPANRRPGGSRTLEAVLDLVDVARPRCGQVVVVAVDGPAGSGKTTLAGALTARLTAPTVHMDDLFPGWDGLVAAPGLLADQVLEPLARGERAAYRRWDWSASQWGERVDVPETDLLVVEGCGSTLPPAGDYAAVRVWVEADQAVRMARGIARDGEVFRPHWERWAAQEQTLFGRHRTRELADLVVDTTPGRRQVTVAVR